MKNNQKTWLVNNCVKAVMDKYLSLLPMTSDKFEELVDYAEKITLAAHSNKIVANTITSTLAMIEEMERE